MTTTHYGFKLFESADKPTWLESWNQTMTDIDQALYNISTGGGDLPDLTEVVQRIQTLEGRMTSAELRLNEDEGAISDMQDSLEELSGLASRLSTLESTVTNNTSRISTLETTVSNNTTRITTVETNLGTVTNTDIPTLQSGISQAQAQNTTQDQQISGLDTRVTNLEGASGGGSEYLGLWAVFYMWSPSTGTKYICDGLPSTPNTTSMAQVGDYVLIGNTYSQDTQSSPVNMVKIADGTSRITFNSTTNLVLPDLRSIPFMTTGCNNLRLYKVTGENPSINISSLGAYPTSAYPFLCLVYRKFTTDKIPFITANDITTINSHPALIARQGLSETPLLTLCGSLPMGGYVQTPAYFVPMYNGSGGLLIITHPTPFNLYNSFTIPNNRGGFA